MMIMHMNDIRNMLPLRHPIYDCDLESHEPFRIVIVTINFFTVEKSRYIHQVEVESQ